MTFLKPNNQSAKDGVRTVLSAIFDRQRSIAAPSSLHSVDYQLVMSCCSAIRWARLLNLTRHSSRLISFSANWDIVNITGSFTSVLLVNLAVDRHSVYMYIVRKIGGPKSHRSFPRISVPLWVCKNMSYFWNHCLIHRVVISRKAILGEPRGENVVSYIWLSSIVFSEISWLGAETIIAKLDDAQVRQICLDQFSTAVPNIVVKGTQLIVSFLYRRYTLSKIWADLIEIKS